MFPKVSILIPCYNAEKWVAQAITSALEQTYSNKEVIVVDDGSTDNSLEIIKSFGDQIYWETQANQGGNVTRNRLLELSTGEWLQYLDADDYLLPEKIEQQINFLSQNPEADIICSPATGEFVQNKETIRRFRPFIEELDSWMLLIRWRLPQTGGALWRKQALIDVGGWKKGQPCCQEHELYLRLLMSGKVFKYLNQQGAIYRLLDQSTVSRKKPKLTMMHRLEILKNCERHLSLTGNLHEKYQRAISQARFEIARLLWSIGENKIANDLIKLIYKHDPKYIPTGGAAPSSYRLFYRFLGFELAEQIAKIKRNITKSVKGSKIL